MVVVAPWSVWPLRPEPIWRALVANESAAVLLDPRGLYDRSRGADVDIQSGYMVVLGDHLRAGGQKALGLEAAARLPLADFVAKAAGAATAGDGMRVDTTIFPYLGFRV